MTYPFSLAFSAAKVSRIRLIQSLPWFQVSCLCLDSLRQQTFASGRMPESFGAPCFLESVWASNWYVLLTLQIAMSQTVGVATAWIPSIVRTASLLSSRAINSTATTSTRPAGTRSLACRTRTLTIRAITGRVCAIRTFPNDLAIVRKSTDTVTRRIHFIRALRPAVICSACPIALSISHVACLRQLTSIVDRSITCRESSVAEILTSSLIT